MTTQTPAKPISQADILAQSIAELEAKIKEIDDAETLRQASVNLPQGAVLQSDSNLYNTMLEKLSDTDARAEADRVWAELIHQREQWRTKLAELKQQQANEDAIARFDVALPELTAAIEDAARLADELSVKLEALTKLNNHVGQLFQAAQLAKGIKPDFGYVNPWTFFRWERLSCMVERSPVGSAIARRRYP